ncbi:MAG: hypothetical protein KBG48_11480 [Kofleriaceae bacterium]|jgi:hypothetical protein|nr:hypothetical protein [Kofleriaceae bacterium]MBP9168006.1 hypothetical protein [Kofleriaceae bacterium]MBP9856840.1 hypothetical protein [Kofleriaceae bacterium]
MLPTVHLTPADQLVVRDAHARSAVALLTAVRTLYQSRRGLDVAGAPRVLHDDALDLINAFEAIAAPIAAHLAQVKPGLWRAWRRAYDSVWRVVLQVDNVKRPLPDPSMLWDRLLAPFARYLQDAARAAEPWQGSLAAIGDQIRQR